MPNGASRRVLAGVVLGVALAAPALAALLRRGAMARPGVAHRGDPIAPFLEAPCERVRIEQTVSEST